MATERPFRLNPAAVRAQLGKLHESLSQADADRLQAILPLFESSGDDRARLGDCLRTLYAQTKPADPQAEFRAFRNRIGKAAKAARVELTLQVDTRKRTPAEQRFCWFTGTELERGLAGEIRIYVVWSKTDRALAKALRDQLHTYLSTSRSRRYQTWDRSQIEVGERREAVIDRERRRAELVLVLVSPNLLADLEAKDDLAAFQQTDTPILPVTLKRVAPEQDQRGLESRAWFPGNVAPSYADLRPGDREQFAQELFRTSIT